MYEQLDGTGIVAGIAGDRPYWRLSAGDVDSWMRTLPPSAVGNGASRWVGEPWDGSSDVCVRTLADGGRDVVAARHISALLRKLGRGITHLGKPTATVPSPSDVRVCYVGTSDRAAIVVDVDMDGFILPLSVDDWHCWTGPKPSLAMIAERMVAIIRRADAIRDRLLKREAGLRRALEETTASIGGDVAPLWLRMEPVPHHENPKHLTHATYAMLFVALNRDLLWGPEGCDRVATMRDVRDNRGFYRRAQRRRANALCDLRRRSSVGSISDIALALIEERGLRLAGVFRQARSASMPDGRIAGVSFERNGRSEKLYHVEGVLIACFTFEGGGYYDGTLSLFGELPDTVIGAIPGRRLADLVDHPAFARTGVTARGLLARDGLIEVNHKRRVVPVEEAERRFVELAAA